MQVDIAPSPARQPAPNVATIDPVALLADLLPPGRPRRVAKMHASGPAKYSDIKGDLTLTMIADHIAGRATYAATLDLGGLARLGAVDIDEETPEAGRAALMTAYRAVRQAGLQAVAIYCENDEGQHYGGHIWTIYRDFCSADAITTQLRGILPDVAEIWPSPQVIRLPFGRHLRAQSYGELWYISDAGELQTYNLDSTRRRAVAIELFMSLPQNARPEARPKITADNVELSAVKPKPAQRKVSPGERAAEDLALSDRYRLARAHILAHYDLAAELENAGAVKIRNSYSCPFCKHSHTTTLTIAPGGKAGFSHSPHCALYNNHHGFDVTNVLMLSGNYASFDTLARALAPHCFPQAKPKADRKQPTYTTPAEREQRHKDAARKKAARKQEAADLRADIIGRAAVDSDMPAAARQLLDVHLMIAGDRGWHRASIARQAELAGYSERWTQKANEYLITHGYLSRQDTSGATTAIWTFTRAADRSPVETSAAAPIAAGNDARSPVLDLERDLIPESVASTDASSTAAQHIACEGGGSTAPAATDHASASYNPDADWTIRTTPARRTTPKAADAAKKAGRQRRLQDMDAPELTREWYKLTGKAKKSKGRQRDLLLDRAKEVQHYRELAYAGRDDAGAVEAPDRPPLTSKTAPIAQPAPAPAPVTDPVAPVEAYSAASLIACLKAIKKERP